MVLLFDPDMQRALFMSQSSLQIAIIDDLLGAIKHPPFALATYAALTANVGQ